MSEYQLQETSMFHPSPASVTNSSHFSESIISIHSKSNAIANSRMSSYTHMTIEHYERTRDVAHS